MEGQRMKKEHKHIGLSVKFILGLTLVGVVIMLFVTLVGVGAYSDSIKKQYNEMAYQIAKTAEGYFTPEQIKEYANLTVRYNKGEGSQKEIDQILNSDAYQNVKNNLDNLRKSMNANDIFVFVFDIDVLEHYDEQADKEDKWKPMYYIADSYRVKEEQFLLGDNSSIFQEYIEDSIKAYYSGVHADNYFISEGEYGYNTSAMYPVVQDGSTVAFVGVEIPMATLQNDINTYIHRTIIVGSLTTLILLILAVSVLVRTLVRPIKLVSEEAEHFVENNNEISEVLPKIKTHDEIQVLSESLLSMQIGIREYIANLTAVTAEKERIGAELSVATEIQASMLPCIFPAFPGRDEFDIYASMNPAKEVGGDFYDFFLIDEDHLGLVMADVSGKGVPAALFMVIAKTLIKNQAMLKITPKQVLEKVNNQLCENNEAEMFVTVWLGIYEISTGKLTAANAGHEYPVVKRGDGAFEIFKDKHGFVLAGMENVKYKEYEIQLHPGDKLFVYTDGVPEATDTNNVLFGVERMLDSLNGHIDADLEGLLAAVRADIDSFVGDAPQFDDITMLALEIKI